MSIISHNHRFSFSYAFTIFIKINIIICFWIKADLNLFANIDWWYLVEFRINRYSSIMSDFSLSSFKKKQLKFFRIIIGFNLTNLGHILIQRSHL